MIFGSDYTDPREEYNDVSSDTTVELHSRSDSRVDLPTPFLE